MIFESTSVAAAGEGYKIAGQLTLLGVTKEIEVEAEYIGPITVEPLRRSHVLRNGERGATAPQPRSPQR